MAKFKIGDKVVFGESKKNRDLIDVTIGKIYTIEGEDFMGLYFIDGEGDRNYAGIDGGDGKATLIID